MFDAKSLLDALVRGAAPSAPAARTGAGQQTGGGLTDILGQLAGGQLGAGQRGSEPGAGGLDDLLRNLTRETEAPARARSTSPAQPSDRLRRQARCARPDRRPRLQGLPELPGRPPADHRT